jgi:hypothetical protein
MAVLPIDDAGIKVSDDCISEDCVADARWS